MNIDFEELSKIPQLFEMIVEIKKILENGTLQKRWLSTKDLVDYTPYKIDAIRKKIQNKELIEGVHYTKDKKTLCFDRLEIDKWMKGITPANNGNYGNDKNSLSDIENEIASSIAS